MSAQPPMDFLEEATDPRDRFILMVMDRLGDLEAAMAKLEAKLNVLELAVNHPTVGSGDSIRVTDFRTAFASPRAIDAALVPGVVSAVTGFASDNVLYRIGDNNIVGPAALVLQ